jgi:hypothetical protein
LILFNFFCGYGLIKGGMGLARENLIGVIAFLTGLMTLGFVLSKRSINRESVEYGLQQSLAAYFKSHNDLKRAAIHEHKAKTFNLDRGL